MPTEDDLRNPRALGQSIIGLQIPAERGRVTSQSLSGIPQQQVSAPALSDVLQGSLGVRGPEDTLLVVNKALSGNLSRLDNQGFGGLTSFSTVERSPLLEGIDPSSGEGLGTGVDGAGGVVTSITPEQGAQLAYWVGWRDEDVVTATAIMGRESRYNPQAFNGNSATGDLSYGLFQVNMKDSLGPARRQEYGLSTNEELFDPIVNATAAFKMDSGTRASGRVPFYPWGPYKGRPPTYDTDVPAARAAYESARRSGLLGQRPVFVVTGGAGGSFPADLATANNGMGGNSIAELKFAGTMVANHPNNWLAKNSSGFRGVLTSGGGTTRVTIFEEGGRAFLFPSLLNYLYYIFQSGFILDEYLGSITYKNIAGTSKLSNHSYGGAVDIGKIGLASENRTYDLETSQGRRVGDKLFTMLSSLPKAAWATEHGCHWAANYGNSGFHTYRDPGHIHLGFNEDRTGTLIRSLKQGTTPSGFRASPLGSGSRAT